MVDNFLVVHRSFVKGGLVFMKSKSRTAFIWLCITPAILLILLFIVVPTFEVFRMSLYSWGGFSRNQEFIGLDNFRTLWNDMGFFRSFQNTVFLIVVVTIFTLGIAILFASILTREKVKGKNLFRIIFYIPNILSIVVVAGIFSAIYRPDVGLLNSIFGLLNLDFLQQQWLGNQRIVIYSIAGALIWQAIGYYMVMYMASISSIPESLYESASIEGASKWIQFKDITLPLIWNNIRTTLTFFIISTINLSFLLVQIMTGGGPDGSTEVFLFYMYQQAYTNSTYGYGMAIGVIVFLFSFILSTILNQVTKRDVIEF